MIIQVRGIWSGILKSSVENETDFFAAGAGSMDVVRLIEEVILCICICICWFHVCDLLSVILILIKLVVRNREGADHNHHHQQNNPHQHDDHHHQHNIYQQVKEASGVTLANEDVFMATQFGEFVRSFFCLFI